MPTENDKPAAPAAVTVDAVTPELKRLRDENAQLKKDLESASKRVDGLEKKLKDNKAAPTGDCVFLGGKTYPIAGKVTAQFAGDEARKGNLPNGLDTELIVLKR